MKFKVGDRVVLLVKYDRDMEFGTVSVVTELGPYGNCRVAGYGVAGPDEIELEHVYNSPLYQALT